MKASTAGRQNKSENIKKCQTEESENNPQQTGRTHVEQSTAARQEQIQKHAQRKSHREPNSRQAGDKSKYQQHEQRKQRNRLAVVREGMHDKQTACPQDTNNAHGRHRQTVDT